MALVQRGTETLVDASVTTTLGTAVDSSKSFILVSFRGTGTAPDDLAVLGYFTTEGASVTGLTFERGADPPAANDIIIEWQVIEHDSVTVEHGVTTLDSGTGASRNVTITEIALADTFPIISWKGAGNNSNSSSEWHMNSPKAAITGVTTLNVATSTAVSSGTITIRYQIVTWAGALVQRKSLAFGVAETTKAAAISPAIVIADSFIIGSGQVPAASVATQKIGNYKFNSTTEMQGERGTHEDEAGAAEAYVVELPATAITQDHSIADVGQPTSQTVTTVADMALTFTVTNATKTSGTGGAWDRSYVTTKMTTTSNVDVYVADAGSDTPCELFVVELPDEGGTNTKTFTVDGIVLEEKTTTFTADGIVLAETTKTFTADGIVKEVKTVTYTIDGLVKAETTKTYTVDGIVKEEQTKTFTVDGRVKEIKTFTFTMDGIVFAETIETFTADGIVQAETTKTFTADGVVQEELTKTFTVDGIVVETKTLTFTIDGQVLVEETKTFTVDGRVLETKTVTFTADGIVQAETIKTFTADGIVSGATTKTFTIDGIVQAEVTETFTVDGLVQEQLTKTFTIDGWVKEIKTLTFTADGIVQAETIETFTADGIVLAETTKTFTADGIVSGATTKTFTIDGIVQEEKTATFTVDGRVKEIKTFTFTIDGLVKEIKTATFTVDGIVEAETTKTFTIDGRVVEVGGVTKTFTMDGVIIEVHTQTFTMDGRVRRIIGSRLGGEPIKRGLLQTNDIKTIFSRFADRF